MGAVIGNMFCTLFLLVLLKTVFSFYNPVVQLPNGKILGRQAITFANTTYYAFQKIPYATPPTGSLRFMAPQPPQNWQGNLNTTTLDVSCYQLPNTTATDSEDCLFLNVFTPQLTSKSRTPLPVLIYIYGGGFSLGSSIPPKVDLLIDNKVIVVTFNYRLGIFGFLSTGNDVIPGNNGLKDQKLAIQWTYNNIFLFGGDPDRITVAGQSAGAASVTYQLLNQDLTRLIKGAILQSGIFLCPWAFQRNPREIAFGVGTILNSAFKNSNDSVSLLEFLQSVDAEDLNSAASQYSLANSPPWMFDTGDSFLWAPVIEVSNPTAVLTEKMYGLLKNGDILRVPTLVGFNSEEILYFNQNPVILQSNLQAFDEDLDLLVPVDMQITNSKKRKMMALSIRDIYTDGEPFGTNLGAGIRYGSDNCYNRPIAKYAGLFSFFAGTYFYQFSYDGKLGGYSVHYEGADNVGHSEELNYIACSGEGCDFSTYPVSDQLTSKRLIKLWTDFVKYQNPTPGPSNLLQNIIWPKLSVKHGNFFYLDINDNLMIKNHPKAERLARWERLYDSLPYDDFDTY